MRCLILFFVCIVVFVPQIVHGEFLTVEQKRERSMQERAIENERELAEKGRESSEKQTMILASAIIVGSLAICGTVVYMNIKRREKQRD